MRYQTSPNWSCKEISDTIIHIYHVVLQKISSEELYDCLPDTEYIKKQSDGSIIVVFKNPYTPEALDKIFTILEEKASHFLKVSNNYYNTDKNIIEKIKPWFLSFQGCLALQLFYHPDVKKYISSDWQLVNSLTGGIYLRPFMLFLYNNHPKIIHPVKYQNYDARETIEHTGASIIRTMLRRVKEAQPGFEGVAFLSLTKDNTHLTQEDIVKIINDKTHGMITPRYSPFFEKS